MGVITDRAWEKPAILIEWEPLEGQTFNPEFDGYTVGHYSTGYPKMGWCLYSRGSGGCWNQRTKQVKAPAPGLQPERIDGRWYWVDDKIPEVTYRGSTPNGEQYRVPPTQAASASLPIRYFQLTDHEREGQLFQIEFREDLFELKVQNEQGKPVTLTLTERELRDAAKHPVDAIRDLMIEAGVPADLIDEGAVKDARRECDAPVEGIDNYNVATPRSINSTQALAQLGTASRVEPTSPELKARLIDCSGCRFDLWCRIVNRVNTPVRCFRCGAITYVMRNDSEMDLSLRVRSDPALRPLGEMFEPGGEPK